jgi:hypothetical protein
VSSCAPRLLRRLSSLLGGQRRARRVAASFTHHTPFVRRISERRHPPFRCVAPSSMCAAGGNSRNSFCCHRFSVFATLLLASAPPSLLLTSARATPLVGVGRTSPLSPLPLPLLSSTSATPLCAASLSPRLRSPRPTHQWLPRSSSYLRSAPPLLASARTPPPGGCRAPSPPLLPPLLASARAPPLRWRPRSSLAFAPAPPLLASARAPLLGGCRAQSPALCGCHQTLVPP